MKARTWWCYLLMGCIYRYDTAASGSGCTCIRCGDRVPGDDSAPMPQGAGYQDTDITLADFKAERMALEQRLLQHIRTEVARFGARTGETVSAIEVGMLEVTRIGEAAGRMVSSVRVGTPLD